MFCQKQLSQMHMVRLHACRSEAYAQLVHVQPRKLKLLSHHHPDAIGATLIAEAHMVLLRSCHAGNHLHSGLQLEAGWTATM